jgi:hypothetical protein
VIMMKKMGGPLGIRLNVVPVTGCFPGRELGVTCYEVLAFTEWWFSGPMKNAFYHVVSARCPWDKMCVSSYIKSACRNPSLWSFLYRIEICRNAKN